MKTFRPKDWHLKRVQEKQIKSFSESLINVGIAREHFQKAKSSLRKYDLWLQMYYFLLKESFEFKDKLF